MSPCLRQRLMVFVETFSFALLVPEADGPGWNLTLTVQVPPGAIVTVTGPDGRQLPGPGARMGRLYVRQLLGFGLHRPP